MYSLGNLVKFPTHLMERGLVMAGGAAGIAAAFNTPLAGIMFAIEEMSRSFEQRTSGTLITAVVIAGITAIALQGNYTYFGSAKVEVDIIGNVLLAILVCGIAGGLAGGLFSYLLVNCNRLINPLQNRWPLIIAGTCGLIIALIGLASDGQTFGTGYHEARLLVSGEGEVIEGFTFYKVIATLVSYLSGIPGGIFAPSLAAGAGLGSVFSPWFSSTPETAIVILCMVGFFSAVVQTPLTAIIIVMEMTDNQTLLLPIMMTAFIAYGISRIINHEAIYRALAIPFIEQAQSRHEPPPKSETNHPG
jgi:H+/Cl- antiporter ClcA